MHNSSLNLQSSDIRLTTSFNWAKKQAVGYVRDQDPVGPWYEAALPGREAFCMRDVSHQAYGAEALGLSEHNFNMLHKFAKNISKSRDWCTFWEIDRLDRPAPVDYKNDSDFWYTLPANFDVLDTCYRLYEWTGDERYIKNQEMLNFYRRTMSDYIATWHLQPDQIMKRKVDIMGARGIPSYVETQDDFYVGVDLVASLVAGCRSYAGILDSIGDHLGASSQRRNEQKYIELLNNQWWNLNKKSFYGFLSTHGEMIEGVRWSLLYWDAIKNPEKLRLSLAQLENIPLEQDANQVEDKSYTAEILYRYGRTEKAYEQLIDLAKEGRNRREYPEVSYAWIGSITRGMMGVRSIANPTGNERRVCFETLSGLSSKTEWAELQNIPILGTLITVRHDRTHVTKATNHGSKAIIWKACFLGSYPKLWVNGVATTSKKELRQFETTISSVEVELGPGKSVVVTRSGQNLAIE